MGQLSHPYMITGKTAAFILIFVGKVMTLFYNTLSRFVIPFLSRGKRLLISWLQSLSTVILEFKKICFNIHIDMYIQILHHFTKGFWSPWETKPRENCIEQIGFNVEQGLYTQAVFALCL